MKYEINSVMKAPMIHVKNWMNPIGIILSEKFQILTVLLVQRHVYKIL